MNLPRAVGLRRHPVRVAAGLFAVLLLALVSVSALLLQPANRLVPEPLAQPRLPMPPPPPTHPPAPTPAVPTPLPAGARPLLPAPVSTGAADPTWVPPSPRPQPLWDLRSLVFNGSVVAEAQIIGSETRPGAYTFIFYVQEWYKNDPGVKDNIVRLTLDMRKNWDQLAYLPRNLIGGAGPEPFRFMLFLGGTPAHYFILGNTVGIFFLREGYGVQTGVGAEQYQGMPVQSFRAALRTILPATPPPLPPSPTPLPTPSDGRPISLLKVGDSYRVYPHRGLIRFGVGGRPTWLGPARLLVDWSSGQPPYVGASYLMDLQAGTLATYDWPRPAWYTNTSGYGSVPHPDGTGAVLIQGGTEDVWGVTYFDGAAKQAQTVYDRNPAVPQWAGADVHEPGLSLSPGNIAWVSADTFLLALGPSPGTGEPHGKSKLVLVNTARHTARLLAKDGGYRAAGYGRPVVYQTGGLSGPLRMLLAPYTGKPIALTPGGPWLSDWVATPDGRRVAWVEATAPPGDWSAQLPSPCIPCGGKDPEPRVQAIAIWDSATGRIYRFKPAGLVWTLGSAYVTQQGGLYWRADGAALLYATHTAGSGASGRATLYRLATGGPPAILATHPWDGTITVLGDGPEGSLYYSVTGKTYYASGDLVQRHPDGRLQVLHENLTATMWWVDPGKWLEVLQEGGVAVYDFATGRSRHASFSARTPSPGDLGWRSVQDLVPMSPNGEWAAYAGSNDDLLGGAPPNPPDRDPGVLIVRVK